MDKNTITVAGRRWGDNQPVFVIAEVGINHDGDMESARSLIHAAKEARADAASCRPISLSVFRLTSGI